MVEVEFLLSYELEWGKWYRSKDIEKGGNPYGSAMINKKWWLEEELNNHFLRFQQV